MMSVVQIHSLLYHRVVPALGTLLIVKVTFCILSNYPQYFPADFQSEFLLLREPYFFGFYQWAFYVHIVTSPLALMLGLLLINNHLRARWPAWHRRLGRIQTLLVLVLVVPSGLAMAFYAEAGLAAKVGFIALSLTTAGCAGLGWRAAVRRQFVLHRRWMERTFVLLCSAVVLRLMGGVATMAHLDTTWTYPAAAWASWCLPLVALEAINQRRTTRSESSL